MKRNDNFLLSKVANTNVLIPIGKQVLDFNQMITLNELGAFIWRLMENDTDIDKLTEAVVNEYEVTKDEAKPDILEFIASLRKNGCIEEK